MTLVHVVALLVFVAILQEAGSFALHRLRFAASRQKEYLTLAAGKQKVSSGGSGRAITAADLAFLDAYTRPLDIAPFWMNKNGLKFSCTGCGRCCQNDGVVWLDSDEFVDMANLLQLSQNEMLDQYVDSVMNGWVKLKNKPTPPGDSSSSSSRSSSSSSSSDDVGRCVFLDDDGKTCTVYDARPVQCRSYPWWPKLVHNETTWLAEACLPESVALEEAKVVLDDGRANKHWSAENGGCEGVGHVDAVVVPTSIIHRNKLLYEAWMDLFPFLGSEDERSRLLARTEVLQAVGKSTKAWVKDFVVKYSLCPFAESVFVDGRIRYRTYLGNDGDVSRILERVRYEVLNLLSSKEEEVATTLIMLPFAFQNFEDFYAFSIELEDVVLPMLEAESRGPSVKPDTSAALAAEKSAKFAAASAPSSASSKPKRRSLLNKITEGGKSTATTPSPTASSCPVVSSSSTSSSAATKPLPEIQLAFFHPSFCWADTDFDAPMNFEKRAPFPTINLLRAARVREYADESKSKKISNANVLSLEDAGAERLVAEFEGIIRLALE